MNQLPLVIIGSARKDGDTYRLVCSFLKGKTAGIVDLLDYKIYPYSYTGTYPIDDQFEKIVQLMLRHKAIIFATPIYWYAMSGLMKTFFDRLTDIVTIDKKAARQMAGKVTYLLAVGADEVLPHGFEEPFILTSAYFDMKYNGSYYCNTKNLNYLPVKKAFLEKLFPAS